MIKRKFKDFMKKYDVYVFTLILMIFFTGTILIWTYKDVPILIKLIVTIATAIYAVIGGSKIAELFDMEETKKIAEKKQLLEELKSKYDLFVSLVDDEANKILKNLDEETLQQGLISVSSDYEYLMYFSSLMCFNRTIGRFDTFIIAACLMYALLTKHNLVIKQEKLRLDEVKNIELSINLDIAINCAFYLISEPSTYYRNENGELVEEKHPKVEIDIPKGLIKDSDLYTRIKDAILRDFTADNKTSIMQTSNMFHLIYLYCREKN